MLILIYMSRDTNTREKRPLKREFWSWECLIEDRKKWLFLGQEKSLKLAFLQNQLKQILKTKERSGTLYREGRASGYPREQNLRHKRSQQEIMMCLRISISVFFIPLHWAGGFDITYINILFKELLQPKCKFGDSGEDVKYWIPTILINSLISKWVSINLYSALQAFMCKAYVWDAICSEYQGLMPCLYIRFAWCWFGITKFNNLLYWTKVI